MNLIAQVAAPMLTMRYTRIFEHGVVGRPAVNRAICRQATNRRSYAAKRLTANRRDKPGTTPQWVL